MAQIQSHKPREIQPGLSIHLWSVFGGDSRNKSRIYEFQIIIAPLVFYMKLQSFHYFLVHF